MTRRFGDRARFAVEVGEASSPELRVVDLWAGGKWLTTDDLVIVFAFWRETHRFPDDLGKVFVARIPADEFTATIHEAADFLEPEFS